MEKFTFEITEEKIKEVFETQVQKLWKDDYSNPIKKALEDAVKEKEGAIKKVVDEIIVSAIGNPEFKEKIAGAVIARMVESALKK